MVLTLALSYGGRQELTRAARRLAAEAAAGELDPETIGEAELAARLYTAGLPEVDLMIRTSGELQGEQLPALADRLRRVLFHRHLLARLPRGRAGPRPSRPMPTASAASARPATS